MEQMLYVAHFRRPQSHTHSYQVPVSLCSVGKAFSCPSTEKGGQKKQRQVEGMELKLVTVGVGTV